MVSQLNLLGEVQEIPGFRHRRKVKKALYERPLFPQYGGGMSKLEYKFWRFHTNNPLVYRYLVNFARKWRDRCGPNAHLGISQLFERVRWEVSLATTEKNFKLNNNHRAFYARLIMDRNEDLKDIFSLRKQRIESTFGPANDSLPSGEHVA